VHKWISAWIKAPVSTPWYICTPRRRGPIGWTSISDKPIRYNGAHTNSIVCDLKMVQYRAILYFLAIPTIERDLERRDQSFHICLTLACWLLQWPAPPWYIYSGSKAIVLGLCRKYVFEFIIQEQVWDAKYSTYICHTLWSEFCGASEVD
jgi:hypothetical protein